MKKIIIKLRKKGKRKNKKESQREGKRKALLEVSVVEEFLVQKGCESQLGQRISDLKKPVLATSTTCCKGQLDHTTFPSSNNSQKKDWFNSDSKKNWRF